MIKIICVGKIKENYLVLGIKDYLTRVNKYHKVEVLEVMDSNIEEEKDRIIKNIKGNEYIVTLDILGNALSSTDLSKKIENVFIQNSNIVFVIGGSTGIHDDIKKKANYSLSFSKMTFPHGLFRLILLEQLYRAFKIMNNETYHK